MTSPFKLARRLWIQAQVKAPPAVRRSILPRLYDLRDLVRLVVRPYMPVVELSGQSHGGPLTVTLINVRFALAYLESVLFDGEPTRTQIGRIPIWRWRDAANWSSGDLLIVQGSRHLIRALPREEAIILPEQVRHALDLSGDWTAVEARFHRNIRKKVLQHLRRGGYQFEATRSERDFREFYSEMALPTTRNRHGRLSRPMSFDEAHEYFSHGFLLKVMRDSVWVSGAVIQTEGDRAIGQIIGVRDGDLQLVNRGVETVTYYAGIRRAHEMGYRTMDFLETGPYLASGLFRHKRTWGAAVDVPPYVRRWLLIRVRRGTPAVARFLEDNPFIVIDDRERLHGLIAVDNTTQVSAETRLDCERRYATPGLESLIVRAVENFIEPQTGDLIVPLRHGAASVSLRTQQA